jgi:hypothetical protein
VRLTISRHNSYDHIRELLASLGDLVPVAAQALVS